MGYFFESRHLFVSLNDISAELDVSLRTVQRELKLVEDTLIKSGLALLKRVNEGIKIEGPEPEMAALHEKLRTYTAFELKRNERSLIIFSELLKTEESVKSGYLSHILSVSGKTLQQDLDYFEEEIGFSHLSLLRKPGYGIALKGREKDKRMCFVHLALQRLEQTPIYSLKEGEFISRHEGESFFPALDGKRLEMIEKILFPETEKLKFRLTDLAFFELLLYLDLAVARIRKGALVETEPGGGKSDEEEVASSVMNSIAETFSIKVSENETAFFAAVLRSAKRIRTREIDEDLALSRLAGDIIDQVSDATGYYYNRDRKFLDALVSHLEPLLNRIKDGITVFNPIKKEIQEDYGVLYKTLEKILNEKFPGENISGDEIGFLTLHFASAVTELKEAPRVRTLVVCTSGIATSRMLTKKLLARFPQLTIIEQGSINDLRRMDMGSFDLVISTVGINDADFEYILVNPMLSEDDERKLERLVNQRLVISSGRHEEREGDRRGEGSADLVHLTEIMSGGSMAVRDIAGTLALHHTSSLDLSLLLKDALEAFSLEKEVRDALHNLLMKKADATGFGLPGTEIALVHGRCAKLTHTLFSVYRNSGHIKVRGMDGNPMDAKTVLLLATPEILGEMELELFSAISIGLLEKDNIETYEKGDEKRILDLVSGQLRRAYLDVTNRIWRV